MKRGIGQEVLEGIQAIKRAEFESYKEFANSVGCLIAEGPEVMTKEQLYDAIKNAFNRIILKQEERND